MSLSLKKSLRMPKFKEKTELYLIDLLSLDIIYRHNIMYVTKFTSFCQVLKRCTQKENCFLFFCLTVNSASVSCLGLAVMLVVPVCFQGLLCIVQHTLIQCQHLLVFLDGQVRLSDEIAPAGRQQWNNAYSIIYLDTDTHLFKTSLFRTTQMSQYQKGNTIWMLLKQETVSGSGISWAICKSAPRSRQITTPAPHHSVFYRPDALSATQPTPLTH